ncbi:MAG: TRAP transporter permease DctM/Q [Spirochaetes bacterium]|nr:MAG: TRAP transporter permease DctM/Q [Spirochaetota bacterium]
MSLKQPVLSLGKAENIIVSLILLLLITIPFLEVIVRKFFRTGIPGASEYIQHLVLWITLLGSAVTSREDKHLALSAGINLIKEPCKSWFRTFNAFISSSITMALVWSSLSFILIGFDSAKRIGGVFPIRLVTAIIPLGFFLMSLRFFLHAPRYKLQKTIAGLGFLAGILFGLGPIGNILYSVLLEPPLFLDSLFDFYYNMMAALGFPIIFLLIAGIITGTSIFVILGGVAYMLFARMGSPLEIIPNEGYSMVISPTIPAIPLFTVAGFILSESNAGKRLVRFFQSFLGWLPGGLVIMAVIVSAFFTTFTGASGVTILALGALLAYVLVESGKYSEDFSTGLLTASGSIGLLFPPSLPIIIYGVVAQINIKHMLIGGIVPGLVMVLALSLMGVITAIRNKVVSKPFNFKEGASALKSSMWELFIPVLILIGYFGGITTLVETGAVAAVYAFIVEVFIHRDIKIKDLGGIFLKCAPIVGGVLIILAVARGLSYYIIDTEVPLMLTAWVGENITSKYLFLILLNLALLVTGCLMDIYSAIMVVAPLIIPLGQLFSIHPVHLGIIFLANLELGYLTPPVGLNLFLASYRFEKPLTRIYRNVIPLFLILLVTVLLITYVPWLSTGLLDIFKLK